MNKKLIMRFLYDCLGVTNIDYNKNGCILYLHGYWIMFAGVHERNQWK